MGKIGVQSFKKSTYFLNFSDNFVLKIVKFSQKIFAIFGLKSSKLQRFFGIWKWTKDEDEDGSVDKNLRRSLKLRCNTAMVTSAADFGDLQTKPENAYFPWNDSIRQAEKSKSHSFELWFFTIAHEKGSCQLYFF